VDLMLEVAANWFLRLVPALWKERWGGGERQDTMSHHLGRPDPPPPLLPPSPLPDRKTKPGCCHPPPAACVLGKSHIGGSFQPSSGRPYTSGPPFSLDLSTHDFCENLKSVILFIVTLLKSRLLGNK
jgi:hypothetical protein